MFHLEMGILLDIAGMFGGEIGDSSSLDELQEISHGSRSIEFILAIDGFPVDEVRENCFALLLKWADRDIARTVNLDRIAISSSLTGFEWAIRLFR